MRGHYFTLLITYNSNSEVLTLERFLHLG